MGITGFAFLSIWMRSVRSPDRSRYINREELDYLRKAGALMEMDRAVTKGKNNSLPKWRYLSHLMNNRMLAGVYIAQY